MSSQEGSVILMENAERGIAFQLRDNRPDVSYPDYWGLFGGWLEQGETPQQAILREVMEELGLTLDRARLKYVKLHRDGNVIAHVFHYPAPSDLLSVTLMEGQRFEFLSLADLERLPVVPRHKAIAEWWLRSRGRPPA